MAFPDPRLHERRRLVAQLLLRHLSTREIGASLRRQGWAASQATIVRDIAVITNEWQRAALMDLGEHKASELARLNEVERTAWLQSPPDLAIILRTSEQRCKLLHLYGYAPIVDVEQELSEAGFDVEAVFKQVDQILTDAYRK